jgi:hypothetical protein
MDSYLLPAADRGARGEERAEAVEIRRQGRRVAADGDLDRVAADVLEGEVPLPGW